MLNVISENCISGAGGKVCFVYTFLEEPYYLLLESFLQKADRSVNVVKYIYVFIVVKQPLCSWDTPILVIQSFKNNIDAHLCSMWC